MNLIHRYLCKSATWEKTLRNKIIPWALEGLDLSNKTLEIGPGPGLTTNILGHLTNELTCIEIDPIAVDSLRKRTSGMNITVHQGDVTDLPFDDQSFSTIVCFTMLHHIPSPALQDKGLSEIFRVLKKDGLFAGSDSMPSFRMRLIHIGDTMTLVNPETFGSRLKAAGFENISVDVSKERFRFRAQRLF
jgi:SAM-dependent methyltransferase